MKKIFPYYDNFICSFMHFRVPVLFLLLEATGETHMVSCVCYLGRCLRLNMHTCCVLNVKSELY